MYILKEEYLYLVQVLFRDIAKGSNAGENSLANVFPQVAIEPLGGNKDELEPLGGDIYGDMIFGYGIKWLAYLIQEGEILIDKSNLCRQSDLINELCRTSVLEQCTRQMAFEICPLAREDVECFVSRMERKYPDMALPTEGGNRKGLVDALYALYEGNHYIGLSGGIKIGE